MRLVACARDVCAAAVGLMLAGCLRPAGVMPVSADPGDGALLRAIADQSVVPLAPTPAPSTPGGPPIFPNLKPWPPSPPPVRLVPFNPAHTLIPFASNRGTAGPGGFDLFIYDLEDQTVLSPPGANTRADEFNPVLSQNDRWLVYASGVAGHFQVWLYDLESELVNPLPLLNRFPDQESPTINGDGTLIACQSLEDGVFHLRLYDLRTNQAYGVPVVDRLGTPATSPFISVDGHKLAFSSPVGNQLDVFIYDLPTATLWSPPFVNTAFNEDEPDLSPDNRRLLFTTDRRGTKDVMEADLLSGFVDPLPLANSPDADDLTPSFVGAKANGILFVSDREGKANRRLLIYAPASGVLDTLPAAHEPGALDTFSPP